MPFTVGPHGAIVIDRQKKMANTCRDPAAANPLQAPLVACFTYDQKIEVAKFIIHYEMTSMKQTIDARSAELEECVAWPFHWYGPKDEEEDETKPTASRGERKYKSVSVGDRKIGLYLGGEENPAVNCIVIDEVQKLLPKPLAKYPTDQCFPYDKLRMDLL